MSILHIVLDIELAKSKADKIKILSDNKSNTELMVYVIMAYSKNVVFPVTGDEIVKRNSDEARLLLGTEGAAILNKIATESIPHDDALTLCQYFASRCSAGDYMIFKRILNKNLQLGLDAEDINQVWEGLIPLTGE